MTIHILMLTKVIADLGHITFVNPKKNMNGGQTVVILNNSETLYLYASKTTTKYIPTGKPHLCFEHMRDNSIDLIRYVDELCLQYVQTHSFECFGKYICEETIQNMQEKSMSALHTFNAKFPLSDNLNDFVGNIYDQCDNLLDFNSLSHNEFKASAIIQLSGIYFKPGKWGASWKVKQLRTYPSYIQPDTYAFLTDEDDNGSDADSNM